MYFPDAPAAALLGTVDGDPASGLVPTTPLMWMEPVTENPDVGDTEIWEFYNATGDAHPMHIHEVLFEVIEPPTDPRRGGVARGPARAWVECLDPLSRGRPAGRTR